MSFRLWTIFYVFALVASAMATFGPIGILAAGIVVGSWTCLLSPRLRTPFVRLVIGVVILGSLIASLSATAQATNRLSKRAECSGHLTQIAEGLLNYEAANGKLPPAYIANANGRPLHSWRVLILPYIDGYGALYTKYNFNEPWDGPNNGKLASQIPPIYRCPTDTNRGPNKSVYTNYFAVVGPETAMPDGTGIRIEKISDGTAHTIALIEARGMEVNWMEPRDLSIDEAVELLTGKPASGHLREDDGFLTTIIWETERYVARWDGTIEFFSPISHKGTARAMLTASRGEPNGEFEEMFIEPNLTIVRKWGRFWSLSVFVILSLLPAISLRRQIMAAQLLPPNEQSRENKRTVERLARG
jgi:hypothetical protein